MWNNYMAAAITWEFTVKYWILGMENEYASSERQVTLVDWSKQGRKAFCGGDRTWNRPSGLDWKVDIWDLRIERWRERMSWTKWSNKLGMKSIKPSHGSLWLRERVLFSFSVLQGGTVVSQSILGYAKWTACRPCFSQKSCVFIGLFPNILVEEEILPK